MVLASHASRLHTRKSCLHAGDKILANFSPFSGSSQAGQRDEKATPLTQFAFDLDLSPVLLRDALCNSEAQARTGLEACIFRPVEALENVEEVTWGNAHTRIGHRDGDGSSIQ